MHTMCFVSCKQPYSTDARDLHTTCWICCSFQGDLQRLLSQETSLKQQVAAVQERIANMERARASDKAFLQVSAHVFAAHTLVCCIQAAYDHGTVTEKHGSESTVRI